MASLLELYSPEAWARLPKPTVFRGWLTGVGSRETPEDILKLMRIWAAVTYSMGFGWRSGGAAGSDEAFEQGVMQHPHFDPSRLEIYLPWNGFEPIKGGPRKFHDPSKGYIDSRHLPDYPRAEEMVTYIHPIGDRLRTKRGAFALHTRNMFQPLGRDLNTPSKYLYCYAKPRRETVSWEGETAQEQELVEGGTRSAFFLAKQHRIKCVNFYHDESRIRTVEFLREFALKTLTA
jgi:hypothetical protein